MKIIIMPDSFKGTVSAKRICGLSKQCIASVFPDAQTHELLIADGGEGTTDAFLHGGGTRVEATVKGPFFEDITGFYGIIGSTAVIEMAACASLPMVEGRKDPMRTTTYGVGELIRHALDSGCEKVILGLGGSCTNDGGCGMASALGVRFKDENGKEFVPTGGTLKDIRAIDCSGVDKRILGNLTVMCDIENPLYGTQGAAYVFAPQKGATSEQVLLLDQGLKHLAEMIRLETGRDISTLKGGGAAGGMGAGAAAFLDGVLTPGIDAVLDSADFDTLLQDADLVITGEGSIDSQSLMGKAISGIARRTKKANVPLLVIAGGVKGDSEDFYRAGITAVVSCTRRPMPFSELPPFAEEFLCQSLTDALRLIKLGMSMKRS